MHMTMKSDLCRTILQPFQFEPDQKDTRGNESHEKETKHIHASAADLLHIRVRNLNWSVREASRHPVFVSICPTIGHTCQPSLPSR